MKQKLNQGSSRSLLVACIATAAVLVVTPAVAEEEASTLAEQMRACASISNAIERLVCFDDLVAALPAAARNAEEREAMRGRRDNQDRAQRDNQERARGQERAAQARIEAAERRAAEAEARLEQERAEQQRAAAEAERRSSEAARNQPPSEKTYITVVEAWQNARGLWRFRLDNGQEWHQTSSEGGVRYREGVNYYIEPGSFGSYFLSSDNNNRRMRIRLVD